jgi:hypothetical protein
MPHIPIPPTPSATTNNVVQQIKDVAEQHARMVMDEWVKANRDLMGYKEMKLTIKNVHKLLGMDYDDRLKVMGVKEWDKCYEFTLDDERLNQPEIILLHRRQTDSGHYIMEYKSKTLWLTKDEIDTLEKIILCMQII